MSAPKRLTRLAALALGLLAALLVCRRAEAAARRLAVVVGNNVGSGARPALRFAESDADKMAHVLVELGGVDPQDVLLLRGQPLSAIERALAAARARVEEWRRAPDVQAIVIFYFSGHSDGEALEIGRERLAFADLRKWLQGTGAEVRLAVLDSCRSGGLVAVKGGVLGPAYDIHLAESLSSAGEVLMTSSAADESALESAEIRGSYFSHHLVSGLRGAADVSGDGLVTLAEAYQYAFARTVSATANTIIGPQHPVYDYRLSGQGELVLTQIRRPSAVLEVPAGFDRMLVMQGHPERVLVELGPQGARRLALQPGEYVLRAWRDRKVYAARVRLGAHDAQTIDGRAFSEAPSRPFRSKGDGDPQVEARAVSSPSAVPPGLRLGAAAGLQRGVAEDAALLPALRLSARAAGRAGLLVALDLASGRGDGHRESHAALEAGYGGRLRAGRVVLGLAGVLGGGGATQALDAGGARWSGRVAAGAIGEISLALSRTLEVGLAIKAPVSVVRREGRLAAVFLPAAWVGLSLAPR